MKKAVSFILPLFLHLSLTAQQAPTRLIVRGDDMGYSHSGNEALIKSFKEGIETSIEVIVPSPWFPEAVKMLKENGSVDVGIHLALTSEWDNIKWRPLTNSPSLQDSNGYFFPMVYPNKAYPQQSIKENNPKIEDVEREFRAQIELGLKLIPRISHISAHMGCTNISEEVKALTQKLAKEYNLAFNLDAFNVARFDYNAMGKTTAQNVSGFYCCIKPTGKGKNLFVCRASGIR